LPALARFGEQRTRALDAVADQFRGRDRDFGLLQRQIAAYKVRQGRQQLQLVGNRQLDIEPLDAVRVIAEPV